MNLGRGGWKDLELSQRNPKALLGLEYSRESDESPINRGCRAYLQAMNSEERNFHPEAFVRLFDILEWKRVRWSSHELGKLLGSALSQYGNPVSELVGHSFESSREALLWLFLGAYHWYHEDFDFDDPHQRLYDEQEESGNHFYCYPMPDLETGRW